MAPDVWTDVPTATGELEPVRDADGSIIDFRWVAANPAAHRLLEREDNTLSGERVLDLLPILRGQPIIEHMIKVFESGKRGRFITSERSSEDFFGMRFMARFQPLGQTMIATLEDISELSRARDTALDQRRMFETACDHSVHGMILSNRHGQVQYANHAMAAMLGYDVETLQGLSSRDVVHPDDIGRNWDALDNLMSGKSRLDVRDKRYIRADGSILYVSVALSIVDDFLDGEPLFINHVRDITEQRAQDERLRLALMEAEEAARLKSQFLANMSHEIRTPLNGIIGMAQVLQHSDLTPEQADNLAVLKESGNTLMALLNDILDLSRIEAGKLEVSPVKADIRHKLSRLFKIHQMAAQEKRLGFRTVIHPSVPAQLVFDPVRVRQCLDNLIANAIKFTAEGDVTVVVTCGENVSGRHRVTIHIHDTGSGIPKDKQDTIFEAFQQMDGSVTRSHGGSGLGLAITRQLATLMGGDLHVVSEPGEGSVFTLTFMAGAVETPRLSPADIPISDGPVGPESTLKGKRALIVDDNAINLRVARTLLAGYGIETIEALDGLEALERLKEEAVDVVLLDIHMPVMDGVKTFARIRALPEPARSLPVIALTADAMSGDKDKYLGLGMTGYVSKPVDEREMIGELTRAFATAGPASRLSA